MGDVSLPAFVGEFCFETGVGVAGAFLGCCRDEAGGVEDASDGRDGWCGMAFACELPGNGSRSRVSAPCRVKSVRGA